VIIKWPTISVYDLDSKLAVAVGEKISAEAARYSASAETGIFPANLLAEEIDVEKQITLLTENSFYEKDWSFCESILGQENELCSSVCTHFACVRIAGIRSSTTAFSSENSAAI